MSSRCRHYYNEIPGFIKVDIRDLALWDLLFYEPCFIFLGIMAGLHRFLALHFRLFFFVNQNNLTFILTIGS